MHERTQKPFLTVETGEAYQPIRLTYTVFQKKALVDTLNTLQCCTKSTKTHSWHWFWKSECNDLPFASLDSFKKESEHPSRLGTLTLNGETLYINLQSFKRACLAISFFHTTIAQDIAKVHHADFINKVFGLNERLPHGFTDLFKEEELERILSKRISDYEKAQENCQNAATAEQAFTILSEYAQTESQKRLPYAERYIFQDNTPPDEDNFSLFLRSRELIAIRRWFGNPHYNLSNAAEEAAEQNLIEINS